MHEKRNFAMILIMTASLVWAFFAWLVFAPDTTLLLAQRVMASGLALSLAVWLFYALRLEDKLPDHLKEIVGEMYYEVDGLLFMPIMRVRDGHAELCVYYQNRFEGTAEIIVHLRPCGDCFTIKPGIVDVHFAFRAGGGDFGVIHQPVSVPKELQGDVVNIQLAAASYYPRGHGARLRKHTGMPCGSILVDWGGAAFKTGVHEVSGEVDITSPSTLHLSMPKNVESEYDASRQWKQEMIEEGVAR